MPATLIVCTTCKRGEIVDPDAPRPGATLHGALAAQDWPDGVVVEGTECLSACDTGCNIALQSPGKWTYVYRDLDPGDPDHLDQIRAGVTAYAASADGIVPWRERPLVFRKQSLARIPPALNGAAKDAPND